APWIPFPPLTARTTLSRIWERSITGLWKKCQVESATLPQNLWVLVPNLSIAGGSAPKGNPPLLISFASQSWLCLCASNLRAPFATNPQPATNHNCRSLRVHHSSRASGTIQGETLHNRSRASEESLARGCAEFRRGDPNSLSRSAAV